MARLSTALVQREVVSLRDIEEALARQVLYGGDVISNLLEYTSNTVDEAALTGVAAEVLGLDAPHVGELPIAGDDLKRAVPADVVDRHAIFPLALTSETLRIAVSEKLSDEALSDLSFSLGRRILQCAALHVRIMQALSRDYDIAMDRRALRGLARLEGRQDPSPSRYPSPLEGTPPLASLPRSPTIPPLGALGTKSLFSNDSLTPSVHEAITAPAPPVAPPEETAAAEPSVISEVPPATEASPSAPAAPVDAPPPHSPRIYEAPPPSVALDLSPASQTAIETVRRPPPAEQSRQSLAAWSARERRPTEPRARSRHRGPYTAAQAERDLLAAEDRDEVLTAFMDFAAQYFEYTALFAVVGELAEGRDAHGPGASRAEIAGVGVPLELPSVLSRARDKLTYELAPLPARGLDAQLARDLQRTSGRQVVALPVAVRGRCVLILYGDEGDQDVSLSEIGDVIAFAPLVSNALETVIRRKKAAARADVEMADPTAALARAARRHTSRSRLPSRDERASALASALEGPPVRSSRGAELDEANRASASSSLGPAPPKPTNHAPATAAPAPRPASAAPPPEGPSAAEVARPRAAARSLGPAPPKPSASKGADDDDDPAGRADTALSQRNPVAGGPAYARAGQAPESSATVALDIEADAARLVDELLAGNQSAVESLRLLGEPGLAALMSYFPGPLAPGAQPTAASPDAGPVLSALVRLGQATVPFLIARSGDANATVRAWAIAVLGHLPAADGALTVARRTVDSDERVRAAARAAGRRLVRDDRCWPILLDTAFDIAARPGSKAHASTLALEAIAAWRMPESVPRLIALVSGAAETAASARWALEVITRQSFGGNEAAWQQWWQTNRERHRVEWLIDALMHPDQEMRRQALEELTTATNQYFGYDESLPEDERALGQRRYRHWWQTEGRSRFARSSGAAR